MVALRDKLARLNIAPRHPRLPQAPELTLVAGNALSSGAKATASTAVRLERLRQALGRALGGASRSQPAAVAPQKGCALPFERQDTVWGTMDMLTVEVAPDARVGRLQLADGLACDMHRLALLGHTPELALLTPQRALFLDTESTGFGTGTGNLAFLVGACHYHAARRCFVMEQVLLRDPDDESAMLRWLHARIANAQWLVSYNGKSFDLPLLRGRSVMCRLPPLEARPHLDLLHTARRVHRYRRFRKTLGTLEQRVLEHHRGHDVSGAEVAERYLAYLHHRREEMLDDVVRHNQQDVLSLVALVALYGGPLEAMHASDLLGVTRSLLQRRALGRAEMAAELCLNGAADRTEALRLCAFVHKASGAWRRAQRRFEELAEMADPEARLELAKLYEHTLKDPEKAIDIATLGTIEGVAEGAHRLARLRRKVRRAHSRQAAAEAAS